MIVCRCNNVHEKDVHELREIYPDLSKSQQKHILKIGLNCGCCNNKDCPIIDKNFQDL